ncbi:hypothetical protein ACJIZ3_001227 [Penstemon smallii]|uniref:Uncharacterized protein n=1 Tax=Penstemon smallii TaxID=265156 RepID=A0ABD3U2Z9_9LAMI
MDLETENRIAAILLKEANELRRQAQSEGSLAYLRQPTVRSRPNSRFLTATVLGVQQANRAVEVNEMWRLREKQLELDNRIRGTRTESISGRSYKDANESHKSRGSNEVEPSASPSNKSKKRIVEDLHSGDDEGLKDDEIEEFLYSRRKRGRGAVGSRMDETGPYLPSCPGSVNFDKPRDFLGPEKPFWLKSESDDKNLKDKKEKAKIRSSKHHSSKHKSKGKSKDKEKKKRTKEKKKMHHK